MRGVSLKQWCEENNKLKLLDEWDYEKNGDLTPKNIAGKSHEKVWWVCLKGHNYQASVAHKTNGRGCPVCANKLVLVGYNDLATTNPELVKEWDYEKNGDLKPTDVTFGCGKKVWWKCSKGHSYQSTMNNRTTGKGVFCPICSNKKVLAGYNDLATTNPTLANEWDYEKNGDLKPTDVTQGSGKKVWWKCHKGHEWLASVSNRQKNKGCPVCNKERRTSFPEQALFFYIKKYYPDAINSDTSTVGMELDIYIPSLKIAIEYDGFKWHKNSKNEVKKNKLCYNKGVFLIRIREDGLCLYDDCLCIIRTDAKSNNTLNDVIIRVLNSIDNKSTVDVNVERDSVSIQESYINNTKEQSLNSVYPEIANEWHPVKNGTMTPDMFKCRSNKKVWWMCSICGNEWQAPISVRTDNKKHGCPVCGIEKNIKTTRKSVMCVETGDTYVSIADASRKTGVWGISISKCCRGQVKTTGGYHWKYV